MSDVCPKFLQVGTDKAARRIAVRQREGAAPGLFWLGGFKSDMRGTKAEALDLWARDHGREKSVIGTLGICHFRVVPGDDVIGEPPYTLGIAACGKKLERADADMA